MKWAWLILFVIVCLCAGDRSVQARNTFSYEKYEYSNRGQSVYSRKGTDSRWNLALKDQTITSRYHSWVLTKTGRKSWNLCRLQKGKLKIKWSLSADIALYSGNQLIFVTDQSDGLTFYSAKYNGQGTRAFAYFTRGSHIISYDGKGARVKNAELSGQTADVDFTSGRAIRNGSDGALKNPPRMPKKAGMMFNATSNEKGTKSGGQLGKQDPRECRIEKYISKWKKKKFRWRVLYRCKDRRLAELAVQEAAAAVHGGMVGYDNEANRTTLWKVAELSGYDLSALQSPGDGSCITTAMIFYKCAAKRLGIESVANMDCNVRSWTAGKTLMKTGYFEQFTKDQINMHRADNNQIGDIYTADWRDDMGEAYRGHTIMQITDGRKFKRYSSSSAAEE